MCYDVPLLSPKQHIISETSDFRCFAYICFYVNLEIFTHVNSYISKYEKLYLAIIKFNFNFILNIFYFLIDISLLRNVYVSCLKSESKYNPVHSFICNFLQSCRIEFIVQSLFSMWNRIVHT